MKGTKGTRGRSNLKEKILPLASHIILAFVSLYCLIIYYTEVADKNLLDLGYVAYLTFLAHGFIGLTKLYGDESFIDLRMLLDYAQTVLPHPFLTAALWQKHSVGPNEIAFMHCLFGLVAFLFFVLMEYKRQDLGDLALIVSIVSSITVGTLYQNYIANAAGFILFGAYFNLKRGDECALQAMQTQNSYYNFLMAAYSLVTLAQFEPKSWVPAF